MLADDEGHPGRSACEQQQQAAALAWARPGLTWSWLCPATSSQQPAATGTFKRHTLLHLGNLLAQVTTLDGVGLIDFIRYQGCLRRGELHK